MSGVAVQTRVPLPGESIAAAAASRNHIFVSTANALHTFAKATVKPVATFAWSRGGLSQPVIGPQGHVYAIAHNQLYVFPPSRLPDPPDVEFVAGDHVRQPSALAPARRQRGSLQARSIRHSLPEIQTADAQSVPDVQSLPEIQQDEPSKTYKPPVLASGNRLFACQELDGDDCGNSQMRDVAENFCRGQGFDRAEDLDVDSRKVVAETLDGRFCSKKKCRVFDQIVCRR